MSAGSPNIQCCPGRRKALALLGGAGAAALFPPVTASGAGSVLDVVAWRGQFPDDEVARFAERTGILVQLLEVRSDRDFLNLMRSTGGREFDLLFPSNTYAPDWSEFGLLRPFNEADLPLGDIHPALMRASQSDWGFGNGLLWVPHLWVGEIACWRGDAEWTAESGRPSFGELWDMGASKRIAGRSHSLLVGAGLYLEASGGIPPGSMAGALEDNFKMRDTWDKLLEWCVARRGTIRDLCAADEDERCLPRSDGDCALAMDGHLLRPDGKGHSFRWDSPDEGALISANGAAMPLGARNVGEAHEFLRHFLGAEAAAACRMSHGLNPAAISATEAMEEGERARFEAVYGGVRVDSAYVFPGEPRWFRRRKARYAGLLAQALENGGAPAT